MKLNYKTYFLLFILLLPTVKALSASPLVIGSAFGPPLSDPRQEGAVDMVVREAFQRIGIEVQITPLPAERSLINANSGINDGDLIRIGGLSRLYPHLVQVPEKIIDFKFVVFTGDCNLRIQDWESTKPYCVGIVGGWKILEKNIRSSDLTQVEDPELLFTLLEKGRADLIIYELYEGNWLLRAREMEDFTALSPPLETRPMYLYLHKRHEDLVPLLVDALQQMKEDGIYERIMTENLGPEETHCQPH